MFFALFVVIRPLAAQDARSITVSVASSLADVLAEIAKLYEAGGKPKVTLNLGGSNTLSRQIIEGAPVHAFISADTAQMDAVARAGKLAAGSRIDLLSNQLVIVVPTNGPVTIQQPQDLGAPTIRRVAMGNHNAVPVGVYAREWLERLKLWSLVHPKMIPLPTARAALAAVREGRADVGIVYATDARSSADVRISYTVPAGSGPTIVYPAAVLMGPRQIEAARFIAFLQTSDARQVFETAGFVVLTPTR